MARYNRRQVLKLTTGAVASVPLTIGTASGRSEPEPDKIYSEALAKLRETGEIEVFRKYLENNGFSTGFEKDKTEIKIKRSNDEVGIQKLRSSTMTTDITMTEYCYYPEYTYVNFKWDFDMSELQHGEKPNDVIGIYYPNNDWERMAGTQYAGPHATAPGNDNPTVGDYTPNGLAFEWDDYSAHKDLSENEEDWPNLGSYVGVKLKKQDNTSEKERLINIEYKHTHRKYPIAGKLKNVSISAGGLTINLGRLGEKWTGNWEWDGTNTDYKCPSR